MSSNKKIKSSRGYRLMFVPFMEKLDDICYYEASKIEEIDYFTSHFSDLDEMIKYVSDIKGKKMDISSAYIERIGGKSKRYAILYRGNLFDCEKVINEYTNYLLSHHKYFNSESPVRFVNLCSEDYKSYEDYVKGCCRVYFFKRNYRDIRGAYVELKDLGLSKRVVVPDTDIDNNISKNQYTYRENDHFEKMLNDENGPDWDNIYSQFDLEDIARLMKKDFGSGRGRR